MDGNKKIKSRKEHIVVDSLGQPMSVTIHPANVHDSVGAEEVFESMRYKFPRLQRILADGEYRVMPSEMRPGNCCTADWRSCLGLTNRRTNLSPCQKDGL